MRLQEVIKLVPILVALSSPACNKTPSPDLSQLTCEEVRARIALVEKKRCLGPNAFASKCCFDDQKQKTKKLEETLKTKGCK